MELSRRYYGTRQHVAAHWPRYLLGFGGLSLAILVTALIGAARNWWALLPLALAALLILLYFFGASLWAAYWQHDARDYDLLFDVAGLRPEDRSVHLTLGQRHRALGLARRLTSGHLAVVDVYNPQLVANSAVARARRQAPPPVTDPRLSWQEAGLDLLPFPNNSVRAVTLAYVVAEFWQLGDRQRLLTEIHRILRPEGRLVMIERVRNRAQWLSLGPAAWRLRPARYWRQLLAEAGFELQRELTFHHDLVHIFQAVKPSPTRGQQLSLRL